MTEIDALPALRRRRLLATYAALASPPRTRAGETKGSE
jgi:hypothetical protein